MPRESRRSRFLRREDMRFAISAHLVAVLLLSAFVVASDTSGSAKYLNEHLNMEAVAKIKVGSSTSTEVEQLLGTPWRTTNYGDCNPADYQELWEYVGKDSTGLFRLHIEFDEDHIVRIIARAARNGSITVLAAAPRPEKQQHHH
jgi:outer membrane protein assembly factor BamE (lipoprotein component of BamABCDE complex)